MNGVEHPYIAAAVQGEISLLASATEGCRNSTLFKCSASLSSLGLSEGEVIRHLKPVAEEIGLRGRELYSAIKSGMKAGQARPRSVPDPNGHGTTPVTSLKIFPRVEPANEDDVALVGPARLSDEVRRHVYWRNGIAVRVKIKRASGSYSNWYLYPDDHPREWKPVKPPDYVCCPYRGKLATVSGELGNPLLWPEGEKDVDTLTEFGFSALTFGGVGDGLPEGAAEFVRNRDVVILADNDDTGMAHAERKAEAAFPVANSLKLVSFPELPRKADVSDFLKASSDGELRKRIEQSPAWSPSFSKGWRTRTISAAELKGKHFDPVKFVLPGYIAEGITIFAGKPKIGKSWLLYDVCVAAAGDRFVLGDLKPHQGDVLYLALEDSQRRLKQRLQKLCPLGNWPDRLTLSTEWKRADEGGIKDLEEWCESVSKPLLIVIDTLERFRPVVKGNTQAYSADYAAITGLHSFAHRRGVVTCP